MKDYCLYIDTDSGWQFVDRGTKKWCDDAAFELEEFGVKTLVVEGVEDAAEADV